ncbi:hypothetical protein Hanom_Chr08g00729141 [Helianthus anomalus]
MLPLAATAGLLDSVTDITNNNISSSFIKKIKELRRAGECYLEPVGNPSSPPSRQSAGMTQSTRRRRRRRLSSKPAFSVSSLSHFFVVFVA